MFVGNVDKVEVKHKKLEDSNEIQNTFAFITIALNERNLQQCLQEFKEQQYRGRYLQVTVARENFLEKLKREREEAAVVKQTSKKTFETSNNNSNHNNAELPKFSTQSSSESEDSSESSDEEEITNSKITSKSMPLHLDRVANLNISNDNDSDEDDPMLKIKSKHFIENGKVRFHRLD